MHLRRTAQRICIYNTNQTQPSQQQPKGIEKCPTHANDEKAGERRGEEKRREERRGEEKRREERRRGEDRRGTYLGLCHNVCDCRKCPRGKSLSVTSSAYSELPESDLNQEFVNQPINKPNGTTCVLSCIVLLHSINSLALICCVGGPLCGRAR